MINIFIRTINSYTKSYKGLPFYIWVGLSASFANALCGGMTFLLSIYLVKNLGMNISAVGYVISCFGVGTITGAYIGGRLSDSIPVFLICSASLILNAISLAIFPYLCSYYAFLITGFFIGLANYSFTPAIRVWLLNHCDEELRLRALSLLRVIVNLGLGFSVWASSSLAIFGFQYAFFGCSFMLLIFSLIFYNYGRRGGKPILANKENNANLNDPITNKNLFDIYMIYGCVFLIGLIFSQLRISYPLYLHEYYHLDSNQFGKIFLINTIIIVLFQAFILDLFAKFNYLLLTGLGSFLIGFGMFLLPFGFGLKYAIFTCLFWTLGEMLFFSTSQILAYNKASQKTKGKSLGTYQMVYASSNILGPACGGYVYHHYTGNMVWYLCGLFGLICLGLCGNSFYCRATI